MVQVWLDMCDTLETESKRINREVIFFGWKFIFRKIYYVYLFMRNFFPLGGSPLNSRKVFRNFVPSLSCFVYFFFFFSKSYIKIFTISFQRETCITATR